MFGTGEIEKKLDAVLSSRDGGIYKRIDETRELLELLQKEAPEFLKRNPWVAGWLRDNEDFLCQLLKIKKPSNPVYRLREGFPRGVPIVD